VSALSLRSSDAERERVVLVLREHLVGGRLTRAEFTHRVDAALRAATADELAAATESLPAVRAPGTRRRASWLTVGLFSHVVRRGRLRLPRRTFVVSAFSDVDLDLRSSEITSGRTSVISFVVFGNVDVYVPEGIAVDVTGLNLFGHRREWGRDPVRPDAPLLRVRGFGVFATVDVWRVPDDVNGRYRDVIEAVREQQHELSGSSRAVVTLSR
jgi:hypothetical protein